MEQRSTTAGKPARVNIEEALKQLAGARAEEVLEWAVTTFGDRVTLACSFGLEDMVLVHMWSKINPGGKVFTLDTGRLPKETYELMERVQREFDVDLHIYFPDARRVEEMVNEHGINLFYRSVDLRKLCCHVRKVLPLQRALEGKEAWITGLRREQSVTRTSLNVVEPDPAHEGLTKINPLVDWTEKEVWKYLKANRVPYNVLHDKGYPSIGCAPCTRAIMPGEHPRAGRWWWESPEQKECGLHVGKGGSRR